MRSVWLIAAMKRMLGLSSLCPRRVRQKLSGAATTVVSLGSVPDLEISSQLDRAIVRKDHSDKARNRDSACVLGEYGASASSDSDVIVTVTEEKEYGRAVSPCTWELPFRQSFRVWKA